MSKTKRIKQEKLVSFNTMIHELKTPLTVIIGFAQLLKEEERYNCDRDYTRAINCIEAEGKRINTIIDKYTDLPDSKKYDLSQCLWYINVVKFL